MKKYRISVIVFIALLLAALIFIIVRNGRGDGRPVTHSLTPLTDTEYIITYRVTSNIPERNYDVVEYCADNHSYRFQGRASIIYTDDTPFVVLIRSPLANGDRATFYVPEGTVRRESAVGLE